MRDEKREGLYCTKTPLTNREREVLSLLRYGKTNADISETLTITERTVKFHIHNIMCKLHASNRTHAAAIAMSLDNNENHTGPNTIMPEVRQ